MSGKKINRRVKTYLYLNTQNRKQGIKKAMNRTQKSKFQLHAFMTQLLVFDQDVCAFLCYCQTDGCY